jgi:hypothetical protein
MNGIIFNTEQEAKDWDYAHNTLTGNKTKYHFRRALLNQTTALTKAQYASLMGISSTLQTDDDGGTKPNPNYVALQSNYTLHKCALLVGDSFAICDEEGTITGHSEDVVDVSDLLLKYKME